METESNHSGQSQPPILVDITTGQEYRNGEPLPVESPLEVVVFKFRKNHESSLPPNYSGSARCDLIDCYCDASSVMENIQMFCKSLRKIAECRGRMCPYTVDSLLKDELFDVLFQWLEIGDDWDLNDFLGDGQQSTNEGNIPNNNSNPETRQESSSSPSSDHSTERGPQQEVSSNEFSPISSTTSPPVPCAENEPSSENGHPVDSSSRPFAWAGLRIKTPALENVRRMDVDEDNTSSEPEISQVLNESHESDDNTSAVSMAATEICPELPSTTSGEPEEEAGNAEPEPETQGNETSSHHINDSSPLECSTISNVDVPVVSVVPNIPDATTSTTTTTTTSTTLTTTSADSSAQQSDNIVNQTEKESVPSVPAVEKVAEPQNDPKSNSDDSQSNNNLSIAQEKPVSNTAEPIKPSCNETDSIPPANSRRWVEGKEQPSEQRKSSFDSSGDSARVRSLLELQNTTSVNVSDVPENDPQLPGTEDGSESEGELEDGELEEDAEQTESQKPTEAPVEKSVKGINNEKRITRSGTNSPVPFQSEDGGVRTRSRTSVPGPASVKRDRESRAAKKSALNKISSWFGVAVEGDNNQESSGASSSAKDFPAAGLRKRLRTSESTANQSDESSNENQTRSSVNKNSLSRKRPKILPDETSSDVPSCSSRSSTPTLDEPVQETRSSRQQERKNSSSPAPVTTRQSQKITKDLEKPQTKTSTEKIGAEEKTISDPEDSNASDSEESSSSDSGESHVSEIPLVERLEKKRKREDRERRMALKGRKTSDKTSSHKSQIKRKKKHGPSLNLGNPESSAPTSTLKDKLPFRIPDIPTNAKKAEELKASTPSILQAAKSQNLLQQKEKAQVETEVEKVITINDNDDDEILMIQEVEVPKIATPSPACAKSTIKRSNSTEGSGTSTPKPGGIHITLTKDKSKGLTPQRSSSIPGTSKNVPDTTTSLSKPTSTRIDLGITKLPLVKSISLPVPDELNITRSAEVDLEDHSRWEYPQNISPRKAPPISFSVISSKPNASSQASSKPQTGTKEKIQSSPATQSSSDTQILTVTAKELTGNKEPTKTPSASQKPTETSSTRQKQTETPSSKKPIETPTSNSKDPKTTPISRSKDPKATPSVINQDPKTTTIPSIVNRARVPTSVPSSSNQTSSSENAMQVSPSKIASSAQDARSLRARIQIFDPKAEAAKPIPKPVPKVTKEIIQQQQASKSVPAPPVPSSSVSKTVTTTITTASSSTPQKECSNISSKSKEPTTAQSTNQKTPEKSQQQDKVVGSTSTSRSSESSARKETGESPSKVPTPQPERSRSPQVIPNPKSKPTPTLTATFADGEIRLLPTQPSSSTISPPTSGSGTWRRGGTSESRREQDFTDDNVDFETPPGDEDDRRHSSSRDRDRNRSGGSSRSSSSSSSGDRNRNHRGGGHQQAYHFQGPPRGRGGGGPPRQFYDGGGRGHPRSRGPFNGGPRGNMINTVVSHGRYQNPEEFSQDFFPNSGVPHPSQFPPQFNPQFGPPPGMYPMMGGPPPPLYPNQQFPPRWPRARY